MYLLLAGALAVAGMILGAVGFRSKAVEYASIGVVCEGLAILIIVAERIMK